MNHANPTPAARMIALGLLAVSMVAAQAPSARGVGHPRLADALLVDAAGPVAGTDPAEARYRPAELDPAAAFSIETAADGTRFLLVRYRAEGGEGIRLLLKRFSLPDGARVFIYDRQGRGEAVVHGPFTRLGPNGDGEFWTPPLSGPEAVLELQFGSLDLADLPFAVAEIEVLDAERFADLQAAEQEARFDRLREMAEREEQTPRLRRSEFRGMVLEHEVIDGRAVFEGDIILGRADELPDAGDAKPGRTDKSGVVITGSMYRWPNGVVPYVIDPAVPDQARITGAIAHWNQQLAGHIQLVPRTTQNDYIVIQRTLSGCSAYVGRIGGAQGVFISDACSTGNVIHEIGHAIGLWHEQSREDRDTKVKINWANISGAAAFNFSQNIADGDDVGAYDYGSIMHYGAFAFSINGLPTIETIPPGIPIGQRTALSAGDIATVKAIYPPASGPVGGNSVAPPATRTVTVNTIPQGLRLTVDGADVVTPFSYSFADGTSHTLAAPTPQTLNGAAYRFGGWTDGATQGSRTFTVQGSNLTYTAQFTAVPRVTLTIQSVPARMRITVNGVAVTAGPYSGTFDQGAAVAVTADAVQVLEGTPYRFTGWSDGTVQTARTVVLNSNVTLTANYEEELPAAPATRTLTIASTPPGLRVFVNGWTTLAPFTYTFNEGSTHSVLVPSPQMLGGVSYVFTGWSDGNTQANRTFTLQRDMIVTANFVSTATTPTTAPLIRMVNFETAPSGLQLTVDGQIVTTPFTGAWAEGSVHTVTAADQTANGIPYTFSGWSDGTQSGTRTIVVSSATVTYRASFAMHAAQTRVTLTANPPGRTLTLDGQPIATPYNSSWQPGVTRTVAAPDQEAGGGSRYRFWNWSDGGTSPSRVLSAGPAPLSLGANFILEHPVTAAAGVTLAPPSPSGFYPDQAVVTATAQVPAGMCFLGWNGLTSSAPVTTVTVNRPLAITPRFAPGAMKVTPVTVPMFWTGGLATFSVSSSGGCPVTASSNVWWIRVWNVSPNEVTFWIDQNRDPWERTAILTVAGITFPYRQGGHGGN